MRVLAWNILGGGRARGDRIVDAIRAHAPDIIVLCEYKESGSAKIIELLRANGWSHVEVTSQKPRQGGIAVLSASRLVTKEREPCFAELERHYLAVSVPAYSLELRAIYGPLHRDTHERYWTGLLSSLRLEAGADVLVVGDFNSGSPNRDAPIPNVFSGKFFDQLPGVGFTDLWRASAGDDAREHTWQGAKNPYRLDHAFGTASIASRVTACAYSHDERSAAISDHSILLVDITTPVAAFGS